MKTQCVSSEFIQRFEEMLKKRQGVASVELRNVRCEICGDNIRRYIGPKEGIACASCISVGSLQSATRHKPLAITRSAIRE